MAERPLWCKDATKPTTPPGDTHVGAGSQGLEKTVSESWVARNKAQTGYQICEAGVIVNTSPQSREISVSSAT